MYPTIIVTPNGISFFDNGTMEEEIEDTYEEWAPGRVRVTPDRPVFTPTPESSPHMPMRRSRRKPMRLRRLPMMRIGILIPSVMPGTTGTTMTDQQALWAELCICSVLRFAL